MAHIIPFLKREVSVSTRVKERVYRFKRHITHLDESVSMRCDDGDIPRLRMWIIFWNVLLDGQLEHLFI